jgi:hypothetical protein
MQAPQACELVVFLLLFVGNTLRTTTVIPQFLRFHTTDTRSWGLCQLKAPNHRIEVLRLGTMSSSECGSEDLPDQQQTIRLT